MNNKLTNISNCTTKLDDIEKLVNNKIESHNVPSTHDRIDADLSARISNLEALTTQLNQKLESLSTIPKPNHPPPQYPTNSRNLSQSPDPNPSSSTLLILGDSNTRHVKIDDSANTTTRIPTMLIEDINTMKCRGFKKIWLHVGINNMKSINCEGPDDLYQICFQFYYPVS